MKITASYYNDALYPKSVFLDECDDSLTTGTEYLVTITQPRNPGNHRRFFEFLRQAFDMQEYFSDREIFRKYLQMKAAHFDEVISPKGVTMYIPRSICWEKLDEIEFKKLFNECINAFLLFYNEAQGELTREQLDRILRFD